MADFAFTPATGYEDATAFPTKPTSEAAFRSSMMSLLFQLRDYINTEMVREDIANNFTVDQTVNGNTIYHEGNLPINDIEVLLWMGV